MQPDYARVEDDALRILDVLCRQPSVSAEARALDATAALVDEFLVAAGLETRALRAEARAWVDFRLVPDQHPDRIRRDARLSQCSRMSPEPVLSILASRHDHAGRERDLELVTARARGGRHKVVVRG